MDHATYENPHQYATGVRDVLVNGVIVLRNGEHTGKMPGRAIKRIFTTENTARQSRNQNLD
jgi:N-acyl-D-amino-acid deacylase